MMFDVLWRSFSMGFFDLEQKEDLCGPGGA